MNWDHREYQLRPDDPDPTWCINQPAGFALFGAHGHNAIVPIRDVGRDGRPTPKEWQRAEQEAVSAIMGAATA